VEYKTYHNEAGTEVQAARATKDDEGTKVQLVGGRPHTLKEGDVVVQTQNANYVDVVSDRDFNKGYQEGEYKASRSSTHDSDGHPVSDSFDPNEHSASEVREYLSRTDIDDTERERVRSAESEGRNRKTAYPE
jgi:hypothetical protein